MQLSEAIRIRIKSILNDKKMNVWTLCKKSAVPCSTLTTFLNGKTILLKLDTLLHICEAFEISLKEFFDDPLFDEVEQD